MLTYFTTRQVGVCRIDYLSLEGQIGHEAVISLPRSQNFVL